MIGEPAELEGVGRDDVGLRDDLVAEQLGDARADEEAPSLVAHDGIADI